MTLAITTTTRARKIKKNRPKTLCQCSINEKKKQSVTPARHCILILNDGQQFIFIYTKFQRGITQPLLRLRSREFIFDVFIRIYATGFRINNILFKLFTFLFSFERDSNSKRAHIIDGNCNFVQMTPCDHFKILLFQKIDILFFELLC